MIFHDVSGVDRQLEVPLQRFGERQRFAVNRDRLRAVSHSSSAALSPGRIVLVPDAQRIARLIAQARVAGSISIWRTSFQNRGR